MSVKAADLLVSCCPTCFSDEELCQEHALVPLIWIAAGQAGCADERQQTFLPGHRLIFDGEYPRIVHLHHEGVRDILTWNVEAVRSARARKSNTRANDDWTFVNSLLAWLEAVHHDWLGD